MPPTGSPGSPADVIDGHHPLDGEVVIDLSSGIAGAYCSKLLADGGADVIKVEGPQGDPLRRWSASGTDIPAGDDGPLFSFLACSKRSVVADPTDPGDVARLADLIRGADGVVWSPGSPLAEHPAFAPDALRELAPHATVVAVTPFGLTGPWAGRPATEGTVQGWAGGAGQRGTLDGPPLLVGGRIGDWETGMVAGVSYLISRHRRVRGGPGELVDVSGLESQCLTMIVHPVTWYAMAGFPMREYRMANLPGVHPTKDGFVGFMCVTGQQWLDFAAMVEQFAWAEDESLLKFVVRNTRYGELRGAIDTWTSARTTAEIVELATLMRVPVAEVNNGRSLPEMNHLRERHWFVTNPRDGFLQPDVPYTLGAGASRRPAGPPPRLGAHTGEVLTGRTAAVPPAGAAPVGIPADKTLADDAPTADHAPTGGAPTTSDPTAAPGGAGRARRGWPGSPAAAAGRPFEGLRVVDFTANWAGPIITHVLGMFGADVIKIESAKRPDALRFNTTKRLDEDLYWEWSPIFHGTNTSKRGLTLDMSSPDGRAIARELIATADVIVENSSPRVMDAWELGESVVRELNPGCVFLRAPAYGLDGPWRERVGYAQTIEMTAGLAWLTGLPEGMPVIPNSPCDPVAGIHALIALLLALEHRRTTGAGMLVEVPMIGGALNFAAEQVVEYSANGVLLERMGNRSPAAAPQNSYRAADEDLSMDQGRWVIVSVENDDQWQRLRTALGDPAWAAADELTTAAGRHGAHDRIDAELAAWCRTRRADEIVETLWPAGVPVAKIMLGYEQQVVEQVAARGWFQTLDNPLTGPTVYSGFPAHFSAGPAPDAVHTALPPRLGQHNHEILADVLGRDDTEIERLAAAGVIGSAPGGSTAW